MTLEYGQVNPQELQKLNELIQMTQDAMRRSTPQAGFGLPTPNLGYPQMGPVAQGPAPSVTPVERLLETLHERIAEGLRERLVDALDERVDLHLRERIRDALMMAWTWTPFGPFVGGPQAERLVETIRERIETGLRDRLSGEIRDKLSEGVRERVILTLRSHLGDLGPLGERMAEDVRSRVADWNVGHRIAELVHERVLEGVRQRIAEGIRNALLQVQSTTAGFVNTHENLQYRIVEAVRERLHEGMRERIHDALRDRLVSVLRDRVADAVRTFMTFVGQPGYPTMMGFGQGYAFGPTFGPSYGLPLFAERLGDMVRERIADELPEKVTEIFRERFLEGMKDRVAEGIRAAMVQNIQDPDRIADHVRERIAEGMRERLLSTVRDRVREHVRERVSEALRCYAGPNVGAPMPFTGPGLPSFINLQQRLF